ncbi:hypothetical protein B0J11DRAFT_44334 [Dendryphion nanum]|uniref:Secreted protein n=1 Tax=Dendryphion nanum TaxID=256645 RepID=A0A9P9IZD1_9PLEO|nr:hypothetical protein B0J11DRAFT_44334 [Dendryphion nanum]
MPTGRLGAWLLRVFSFRIGLRGLIPQSSDTRSTPSAFSAFQWRCRIRQFSFTAFLCHWQSLGVRTNIIDFADLCSYTMDFLQLVRIVCVHGAYSTERTRLKGLATSSRFFGFFVAVYFRCVAYGRERWYVTMESIPLRDFEVRTAAPILRSL